MAIHIFESQHWINYLKTVFLSCINDPWLRCLPLCNVHARVSSNKVTTWVGCCQTFFFLPAIFLSKCLLWLCILAPSVSHYPAIVRMFISVLAHSNVPPPKQCIVPRPQQRHLLPTILRCLEEGGNKDFKYDATWNPAPWVLKLKPGFYWLRHNVKLYIFNKIDDGNNF